MIRSAFTHIAVFSYVVRSLYTCCLIFLVSFSILYMHVPHIIAILSSRRPECPFQFKASPGFEFEFKKERKSQELERQRAYKGFHRVQERDRTRRLTIGKRELSPLVSYIVHQKSSETSVIRHRDSPIFRAFAGLYSRTLELTHIHATSPAQDDPQRHIPLTPITLYLRGSWFVLVLGWFSSCSRQLSASFWSPPRGVGLQPSSHDI